MADQSSTLKVEDLEEGKRYKVSFEGVWSGEHIKAGPNTKLEWFLRDASSIEELPDPEPQWRDGTLIRFSPGGDPLIYDGHARMFRWANGCATTLSPSDYWRAGTLEILYQPGE